jgi:iron complex outermembrane receptor protein
LQTNSATATTTDEEAEQFDESDFILGTTDVENEQEQLRLMLDASHDWTDRMTTNFQVSYGETERSFFTIVPDRGTFNPATREVNTADFADIDEFESLNARLDTAFEFDTGPLTHRGIIGIEYRYWEQVGLKGVFTASPNPILDVDNPDPDRPFSPLGPGNGLENEEESFEGFFQDAIEVNRGVFEGVRVIGGGRVVNYRTFGRFDGDRDGLEFVPRVGVGYTPPMLDWLMVFGNYSESFHPQGDAEPEEGEQWEAGLKATFLDDRLTASLVWFDLKNTNVPVTNLGVTEFIGEQENTGVELEVVGELLPNLQIYGQYAYHDSEILVDDNPNRVGNELQITPTHSGSVWLRYDLPMFSSPLVKNASDRLTLAGGLVYVGDRYATENNQIELTSYVRLDLMARYELAENTSFQLNLQNVTDTRYFTGGNIDAGFTGSVTPGQPLTVTASITHEF